MFTVKVAVLKNRKKIYHFEFDNQQEMNKYFIRLSEITESPKFKNKQFTRSDILDYEKDYYNIVLGHNIAGTSIFNLYKTMNYLYPEENIIYKYVKKEKNPDNFCMIATFTTSTKKFQALPHELAHALYYLNNNYYKKISDILGFYNLIWFCKSHTFKDHFFNEMYDILQYKEYHENVWQDEIHAFLLDLALGSVGFFYGRTFPLFLKQLFKGKVHFHFKYKKISKEILKVYEEFVQDIKFKSKKV
jgi:hypothetical protein